MALLRWICRLGCALVFGCLLSGAYANPIKLENDKPGTWDWYLWRPAAETSPEIEGYASLTSVNRGGQISFFVNTPEPNYSISIYRVGWYGGAGGRQVLAPVTRSGRQQIIPTPDPVTGLIECRWVDPYTITIPNTADPTDWASGFYVAKLTAGVSGKENWILFVVRDDARPSEHLFQASTTTWQAYNNWGGKSLYNFSSTNNTPARKVSFNRPTSAGLFLNWEVKMLRFMEREGYDVSYISNLDLHERGGVLLNHKSFLSVGHDEYWSYAMRDAAQTALAQKVNLGFFSANSVYWQVRFEPSSDGAANRTMVAYKEAAATQDPYWTDGDPGNNKYITSRFRDIVGPPFNVVDPVARPENALIGVMYHHDPVHADIVVTNANHWVFANTGITNTFPFKELLGYEADRIFDNGYSPAGLVTLAESPHGDNLWSHMTLYTAPSGAMVFATGSMQWTWGLDNGIWGPGCTAGCVTKEAQQTTRNILARFASATTALRAPVNLQASAGDRQVSLNWSTVSGATSYNVYRATTPGGQGTIPHRPGISATSFTETGLANGTTYYYHVTAVNQAEEGPPSAEASARPSAPIVSPPPPSSLQAVAGDRLVNLSWGAATGATSYHVYRATTSGGQGATPYRSNVSGTSLSDTGLVNGTTYYYQVASVSSGGVGTRSGEVRATPMAGAPTTAPVNLWVTPGEGQLTVEWANVSGATGYHVYRATSPGGQGATPYVSNLDASVLFDTGLTAGTTYYYQIAAVNASGVGPRTIEVGGTPSGAQIPVPAAPANLKAVAGDKSVTLSWSAASGATSYNVYRSTTSNGQGTNPFRAGVTGTSFFNTNLTNGTTYYYKVAAVNASGVGPRSAEVSARPARP